MNINLHIDRLVLDGFDPQRLDSRELMRAIESELVNQLTANGIARHFQRSGAYSEISSKSPQTNETATSLGLGSQIAGIICGSISENHIS
jgi:hypothetical protein